MRTAERAIVEAIVTAVPMIDSTIEWSTLPLTEVPTLIRHHPPPGTDGVIPRHIVPNRTSAPTAGFCTSGNRAGMSRARPRHARVESTSRASAPWIMWLNQVHHFAAIISPRRRFAVAGACGLPTPPAGLGESTGLLTCRPSKVDNSSFRWPLAPQDPRGSAGLTLSSTLHPA